MGAAARGASLGCAAWLLALWCSAEPPDLVSQPALLTEGDEPWRQYAPAPVATADLQAAQRSPKPALVAKRRESLKHYAPAGLSAAMQEAMEQTMGNTPFKWRTSKVVTQYVVIVAEPWLQAEVEFWKQNYLSLGAHVGVLANLSSLPYPDQSCPGLGWGPQAMPDTSHYGSGEAAVVPGSAWVDPSATASDVPYVAISTSNEYPKARSGSVTGRTSHATVPKGKGDSQRFVDSRYFKNEFDEHGQEEDDEDTNEDAPGMVQTISPAAPIGKPKPRNMSKKFGKTSVTASGAAQGQPVHELSPSTGNHRNDAAESELALQPCARMAVELYAPAQPGEPGATTDAETSGFSGLRLTERAFADRSFGEGDRVLLVGLSRQDLNSKAGTVLNVDLRRNDRFPVRIDVSDQIVSIRAANLLRGQDLFAMMSSCKCRDKQTCPVCSIPRNMWDHMCLSQQNDIFRQDVMPRFDEDSEEDDGPDASPTTECPCTMRATTSSAPPGWHYWNGTWTPPHRQCHFLEIEKKKEELRQARLELAAVKKPCDIQERRF